jgi:hypothetical protein
LALREMGFSKKCQQIPCKFEGSVLPEAFKVSKMGCVM